MVKKITHNVYFQLEFMDTPNDTPWHIEQEQDAQECINYFFNMLVDLRNPDGIPDALTVTPQNYQTIAEMQTFVREKFAFTTAEYIHCDSINEGHFVDPQPQLVLSLDLPDDSNGKIRFKSINASMNISCQ